MSEFVTSHFTLSLSLSLSLFFSHTHTCIHTSICLLCCTRSQSTPWSQLFTGNTYRFSHCLFTFTTHPRKSWFIYECCILSTAIPHTTYFLCTNEELLALGQKFGLLFLLAHDIPSVIFQSLSVAHYVIC